MILSWKDGLLCESRSISRAGHSYHTSSAGGGPDFALLTTGWTSGRSVTSSSDPNGPLPCCRPVVGLWEGVLTVSIQPAVRACQRALIQRIRHIGGSRDYGGFAGQSHSPKVIFFSMIKFPRRIPIGTVLPGGCFEIKAVSWLKSATSWPS